MTLVELRALRSNKQVAGFLMAIRAKESSLDDRAYFMRWPGKTFALLDAHPNILEPIPGKPGLRSSAAGAYQITGTTFRALQRQYGFSDFQRHTQDMAAIALIAGRGALQDVLAGRFEAAVAKCRQEWTSLPGAEESRSSWTMAKALAVAEQYGFVQSRPAFTKHEQTVKVNMPNVGTIQPNTGNPMPIAPLIAAFGPLLAQLIPQVAKALNPGERGQQNLAAAESIINAVVTASGQPNIQSAVEAMQADPALTHRVTESVVTDPAIIGLLEIGGGIQAARVADVAATQASKPFWYSPSFWVTVMLLPLLYLVVSAVVFNAGGQWSDEMRSVVVTAIVTGLLASVTGFYLGSSYGSQKKDEFIERKPL